MNISEIEQYRLERAVRNFCCQRNQSIPAELGKIQYEIYSGGAVFSRLNFLLDSVHSHSELPLAKLEYDKRDQLWMLYIAQCRQEHAEIIAWLPYPNLARQKTFDAALTTLGRDPEKVLW